MSDHLTLAALLAMWGAGMLCGLGIMIVRPRRRDTLAADLWQATLDARVGEIARLEDRLRRAEGYVAILQRERRDHYGEAAVRRDGKEAPRW